MEFKLTMDLENSSYQKLQPSDDDLVSAINDLKRDCGNILTIECTPPLKHIQCIQGASAEGNNLTALVFVADNNDKEQEYGFETELSADDFLKLLRNLVVKNITPDFCDWDMTWSAEEERQETQRYLELAQTGNAEAQYCLGVRYRNGSGVQQDYFEAIKWLRKAAEQNIPHAQIELSFCYRYGEGVEKSEEEAVLCVEKAVILNTFSDKYSLNRTVELPHVEFLVINMIPWLEHFAKANNSAAQYCVGMFFRDGIWCQKNIKFAVKWLTKAAEQGHAYAQHSLGICYRNIEEIRNINIGRAWLTKAAENGLACAQCALGNEYYYEQKDFYEAFKWYKMAAEQGYSYAQYRLGICYRDKKAIKDNERYRDYGEAIKWFEKAAAQGHEKAAEYAKKLKIFDWEGQQVKLVNRHLLTADGETALVFWLHNFYTKSFTIPKSIKRVAEGAFRCGQFLETITIPSSVEHIDSRTFTASIIGTFKHDLWPQLGHSMYVLDTENYELNVAFSQKMKCLSHLTTIIYKGSKQQWNERFSNVELDGITLVCKK